MVVLVVMSSGVGIIACDSGDGDGDDDVYDNDDNNSDGCGICNYGHSC